MSYKVLIVDDEQVEREGLRAILRKSMPSLEIDLARDGDEAMEKAAASAPDLVLMDIRMPGVSGLEAVRRMSGICPDAKYIMVTAYDTFDYARSALQLGVRDYLLKPSRAADIVGTVAKVLNEIQEERKERTERDMAERTLQKMLPILETDVVTQLLFDHVHEVHLAELVPLLGGATGREAFVMLLWLREAESAGPLHTALRERIRQVAGGWVGALSGRQIPLIVFREGGKSYRAQAASLARSLFALEARFPGTKLFVGIGGPYASLEEIRQSYQEALIATVDPDLPAGYRFYEDMPAFRDRQPDVPGQPAEKQLMDHIRSGRWADVQRFVMAFIDDQEKNGAALVYAGQRTLELLWVISRGLAEAGVEAARPALTFRMHDYRALRAEAGNEAARLVKAAEAHYRNLKPGAVERIKQYIADHACEPISLEQIAAMVQLSPFYVSKIFKEETGENYIEFLTECRIGKAKSLLLDPERSLKQIAIETGYHDPNYFSKVFKKATGVSPSEFRKQLYGRTKA